MLKHQTCCSTAKFMRGLLKQQHDARANNMRDLWDEC